MPTKWHRVGHRGAPREFPANTMQGFQRAVEYGCTMVECDVRQAADGELVLAHDPQVTDVAGKVYVIEECPSPLLRGLNLGAGEGTPTLTELAQWARGQCAVMADMKCEGGDVEERVVAALSILPLEAKIVPGAVLSSRRRFRTLDSTLPLSLSIGVGDGVVSNDASFEVLLPTLDTEAVTWQYPLLDAYRIAQLHAHHRKVYAWTVDDLPTMQRLRAAGVDGLISNRPDLLTTLA